MNSSPVRPRPLSQCLACLVGETPAQRKTLETLAARTGFGGISTDEAGAAFPDKADRRLAYFFFHCMVGNDLLRKTLSTIRTEERLRFSPAVLVVGECTQSEVAHYINLGFDDIVVLPEAARVLERRFNNQLTTPVSYFETSTYFGPDRRRSQRLNPPSTAAKNGAPGEYRHVRYLVQRAAAGIEILRREVVISSNPAVSAHPVSATIAFGI
jgi:hypothetical protein